MKLIRIATRKSPLALWQAQLVQKKLQALYPRCDVQLIGMTTEGDKILDTSLAKIGGKGLFVKELEQALLEKRADIAVHSIKDLPAELPAELLLAAVLEREDPRDVLVSNHYANWRVLPADAIIGTSSLRRQCQLLALRGDLSLQNLRGNVGTRLKKLDEGLYAAIILAAAGLDRLGLTARIRAWFSCEEMLPAVGQAAIGIECRSSDQHIQQFIAPLNHPVTHAQIRAERALNFHLRGGCQVPIAAFAEYKNDQLWLRALVGHPSGRPLLHAADMAPAANAEKLGATVAKKLFDQGAAKILSDL